MKILPAAIAVILAAPASALAADPPAWDIDTGHAHAQFKVRHMMVANVRGELGPVSGTIWLDEKDVTKSRVEASIDATKIDTNDAKRDEHLRSPDFLDTAKFPKVTFKSTSVKKVAGGGLKVAGELTMHGNTRAVTLDVDPLPNAINDPWGNTKRGASARTKLSRKDFGLKFDTPLAAGGVMVGDEVIVDLDLELVKKK